MGKSRDICPQVPVMMIDTDASLTGWGAVCNGVCAGRLWSPEERRLHINRLELLVGSFEAVFYKGHACTSPDGQQHCLFLCQQDGETHSFSLMATWCFQRGITLFVEYLPGINNQVADRESQLVQTLTEWKLYKSFSECATDAQAMSSEPFASPEDQDRELYSAANYLMLKDSALVSSSAGTVNGLSNPSAQHKSLLRDPYNRPHPQKSLRLVAWKVSGNIMLQSVFQSKLQNCWPQEYQHCLSVRLGTLIQLVLFLGC